MTDHEIFMKGIDYSYYYEQEDYAQQASTASFEIASLRDACRGGTLTITALRLYGVIEIMPLRGIGVAFIHNIMPRMYGVTEIMPNQSLGKEAPTEQKKGINMCLAIERKRLRCNAFVR